MSRKRVCRLWANCCAPPNGFSIFVYRDCPRIFVFISIQAFRCSLVLRTVLQDSARPPEVAYKTGRDYRLVPTARSAENTAFPRSSSKYKKPPPSRIFSPDLANSPNMQTPASSRPPSLTVSIESEQPTNTLIIPNLPQAFFEPAVINALKQHFESYGELYAFIPLKGFKRILVVYKDDDDAEAARDSDGIVIGHDEETQLRTNAAAPGEVEPISHHDTPIFTLRVYRGDPTPLQPANTSLRPPEIEHNYLISPPGSPPVGWEQVREEPPNTATLADDLVRALEHLKLEREMAGRGHEPHVLVSGGAAGEVPRVLVQDADWEALVAAQRAEEISEWNVGSSAPRLDSMRTARPPVAEA